VPPRTSFSQLRGVGAHRSGAATHGGTVAGSHVVGQREEGSEQYLAPSTRSGIRTKAPVELLGPEAAVQAGRLPSSSAELPRAVEDGERSQDEIAAPDVSDGVSDLLDDAYRLVAGAPALLVLLLAAVEPQVRAADRPVRHPDDGIGGRLIHPGTVRR